MYGVLAVCEYYSAGDAALTVIVESLEWHHMEKQTYVLTFNRPADFDTMPKGERIEATKRHFEESMAKIQSRLSNVKINARMEFSLVLSFDALPGDADALKEFVESEKIGSVTESGQVEGGRVIPSAESL